MNKLIAASAALGLLCIPQLATAGSAPQTVTISVSSQGLDLRRTDDMRMLRNRIADAAAEACDPSDRMIVTPMPDYQCRRAAIASVEPAVRELVQATGRSTPARR